MKKTNKEYQLFATRVFIASPTKRLRQRGRCHRNISPGRHGSSADSPIKAAIAQFYSKPYGTDE